MINFLFELLITKTIGLTLLTLIILSIRPLVLRGLNAATAYRLWLMLPLFLLLPQSLVEQSVNSPVMVFFPGADAFISAIRFNPAMVDSQLEVVSLTVWLVGLVASLCLYFLRYQKLNQSLIPFDYQLPTQQLSHKAKFKFHSVAISQTPLVNVPAIFGLNKANLILPKGFEQLSEQKQLMILRHEFYHLARRDHQVNFLRVLLKSLFWFNPLVYWADKFIEADQELSCDLGVLSHSPNTEKKHYAKALVESVSGINQNYLVSQWQYQSLIKQRIKMLKNTKQKKWHSLVAGIIAIGSISATNLVVAGDSAQAKELDAKPIVVVNPDYPRKAVEAGVEGEVKFKLTIAKSGKVVNPVVIESSPQGVFEESALKAIKQWEFKPRVVKGQAVEQTDMHYTMQFKLAE